MTTKTIECVECGERVPYGRLSCPSCGELLAAVSRSPRTDGSPTPRPVDRTAAPAYLIDPAAPMLVEPEPEAWEAPWPPLEEAGRALVARSYGRGSTSDTDEPGSVAPPPGAYVPPNLALWTATAAGSDRPSSRPAIDATPAASTAAPATAGTAVAGARPAIDAARVVEAAGWLVVVGSAMAVLGFLLPWSVAVIGASGSAGYLDHWGLASPSHVLVIAGLLAVLALGVVQTPIPAWLRTGILGLGLGGLLLGLTWPYVLGPLGADIGVLVTGLGGLALVIGGGVASWATRHEGADPLV